jgi:broad specificity phosphatase PhoE
LAEIFPVFGLQPQHFMSSRRSVRDYLRDFDAGVVSYRELACGHDGYREVGRSKPMTVRDRHEFTYHIMRFLMHNLVKLVRRGNLSLRGERLLAEYFLIFPEREDELRTLFEQLRNKKRAGDFAAPLPNLERGLLDFVETFESQFRQTFFNEATRHLVFRHAPTALNHAGTNERVFLGRTDPPIARADEQACKSLATWAREMQPAVAYASPRLRCRQSLQAVARHGTLPPLVIDERLQEIDYGQLEGMTVSAARAAHADLFQAFARGEDARFPDGECSRDVAIRVRTFVCDRWLNASSHSVTCTHNVVLRALVGHVLGLPVHEWHRLEVPHLAPVTFVATRAHGLFVDIPSETARVLFADFAARAAAA